MSLHAGCLRSHYVRASYRLVLQRQRYRRRCERALHRIGSILAKSQVNNRRFGVTGALTFNSGCFAQVLEGPFAAVEEAFERIQQDARHGEVWLVAFDRTPARAFEQWSMGFVGASVNDAARYGALVNHSGFDPARMTGEALFETLYQLALAEERSDVAL